MSEVPNTRSIYRHFLRVLGRLSAGNGGRKANLRRLYGPQLKPLLMAEDANLANIQQQANRTLALLSTSPKLMKNLASLSYHYYPHHLPHTNNARRLVGLPAPIKWDPRSPSSAMKSVQAAEKKRARDPATIIGDQEIIGLRNAIRRAEKQGGVLLGRIEKVW